MNIRLQQTRDDIYLVLDQTGKTLGSFYAQDDDPRWWTVCFRNGTARQVWQPDGDTREVARRAFGS